MPRKRNNVTAETASDDRDDQMTEDDFGGSQETDDSSEDTGSTAEGETAEREGGTSETETDTSDDTDAKAAWLAQWVVGVNPIEGTAAHAQNVTAFNAVVNRNGPKDYTAQAVGVVGKSGGDWKVAVNNLLRARKLVPSHFTIEDVAEPEKPAIGDNTAVVDPWIDNLATAGELNKLAAGMVAADNDISKAEDSARASGLALGNIVLEAWKMFSTFTKTGGVDKQQWGRWIVAKTADGTFAGHDRLNPNTLSEARRIAELPSHVLALCPREKASAKAILKWYNESLSFVASVAAKKLFTTKESEKSADDLTQVTAGNAELAGALDRYIKMVREDIARARTIAEGKADANNKDPQRPRMTADDFLPPNTSKDIVNVTIYDSLTGELPKAENPQYDTVFAASSLGKALLRAWRDELKANPPKGSKIEPETKPAKEEETKVGFADYTVEDAANHLLNILVSRPDVDDQDAVIDRMIELLSERRAKAAEAADKTAAEGETAATE